MDQNKEAFQKQDPAFVGAKRILAKKSSKQDMRYWRNVGLSFTTPDEQGKKIVLIKKCPSTGNVRIRGKILKCMVISTKMEQTIIIRRNYLHYIKKFYRLESVTRAGR